VIIACLLSISLPTLPALLALPGLLALFYLRGLRPYVFKLDIILIRKVIKQSSSERVICAYLFKLLSATVLDSKALLRTLAPEFKKHKKY
jgi:hypothetical protein